MAQTPSEEALLRASNAGVSDLFGWSVAIDGDRAIVGAYLEDNPGSGFFDSGAAYLFERQPTGAWQEVQILRASTPSASGYFGRSVTLYGDRAIIGAPLDDGGIANSGAAYVFERQTDGTWQETQILRASNAGVGDRFGYWVAMDGDRAVVGALVEDGVNDGLPDSGAAYLFERQSDGTWQEVQILRASNAGSGDYFGLTVSISGSKAVVGAFLEDGPSDGLSNSGAAYVFERQSTGAWQETQILRASNAGVNDYFGWGVSVHGSHIAVSAVGEDGASDGLPDSGAAYLLEQQADGTWQEVQRARASNAGTGDSFGYSVALREGRALVGAFYEDGPGDGLSNSGAAYVLERQPGGTWQETQILRASNAGANDQFGESVALGGSRGIVGASVENGPVDGLGDSGAAYVYRFPTPPTISVVTVPEDPVPVGAESLVSAAFTDPGGAAGAPYTCMIDPGDGSGPQPGTVLGDGTAGSTCTLATVYATPGVYTVTVQVTDAGGASSAVATASEFVVVYDPSAGFVTGGGWIDSPAGAYAAAPSLAGTASFGLVAKYKKGKHVPDGNTQFRFHAGDLRFQSDAYDWLVIAGAKAKYKGTGTVNGTPGYRFYVTGVDGDSNGRAQPDAFRIKIWQELADGTETVVYDNQPGEDLASDGATELQGGSIVIHDGSGPSSGKTRRGGSVLPTDVALRLTGANPVRDRTRFAVDLPEAAVVTVRVYDLLGRRVATLIDRNVSAGRHALEWAPQGRPSGMYLVRLSAGAQARTLKVIVVR